MKPFRIEYKSEIRPVFLIIFLMTVISISSFFNIFAKPEYYLRDALLNMSQGATTDIVIVAIDEDSISQLGKWPWPRSTHAMLIDKIVSGNPSVIGIDLVFSENDPDPNQDAILSNSVKKAENIVLPVYGILNGTADKNGKVTANSLVEPIRDLSGAAKKGHINIILDEGYGYVRTGLISIKYNEKAIMSFDWVICNEYFKRRGIDFENTKIPVDASNRMNIDFAGKPGTFEHLSYYQVLKGEVPPEYFNNKIVLIGTYASGIDSVVDYYYTPADKQQPMYGVEIHPNIIQNMLEGNYKRNAPDYVNIIVLLVISLLGIFIYKDLGIFKFSIICAFCSILYIFIYFTAYLKGYILQIIYPLILLVSIFVLLLGYRYFKEYLEHARVEGLFGRFVAPQVVNEILKSNQENIALGGIRKDICVLFADIRGFTSLSEKTEPEEVVEILNEYLDMCTQSIHKYGGTVDKFIGDAVMAIFNAPLDVEDYIFKTVQAAWMMKEGATVLEEKLKKKYHQSIKFGVGINAGSVIIGNIGSRFRMDYTAIGDTVNTTARLENKAAPGQILLSKSAYDAVKDRVKAVHLGEIKVKGKEHEISVYQLEGLI